MRWNSFAASSATMSCRKARRRYPRCLMILLLLFQLPRLQGKNFCIVYYHMYIWLFRSKLLSERDLQFSPLDQDAFKLANYWISFLHWAAFYGGWQWRVQRGNSFSKLCLSWYLNIMTLRYQYHHQKISENKENKKSILAVCCCYFLEKIGHFLSNHDLMYSNNSSCMTHIRWELTFLFKKIQLFAFEKGGRAL